MSSSKDLVDNLYNSRRMKATESFGDAVSEKIQLAFDAMKKDVASRLLEDTAKPYDPDAPGGHRDQPAGKEIDDMQKGHDGTYHLPKQIDAKWRNPNVDEGVLKKVGKYVGGAGMKAASHLVEPASLAAAGATAYAVGKGHDAAVPAAFISGVAGANLGRAGREHLAKKGDAMLRSAKSEPWRGKSKKK